MFNSLYGKLTEKLPQTIYLLTNGIEWDISIPDTAIEFLPAVGSDVRIFTWMYHKEDTMKLYGFSTAEQRLVFLDLLKVDGIGPRAAVKMLSNISCEELENVLNSENMARLERIPGVGKKTAQKMMLTLKGKLTHLDDSGGSHSSESKWQDVISALLSMGYDKKMCEAAVLKAEKLLDSSAAVTVQEEQLFRAAIIELAT